MVDRFVLEVGKGKDVGNRVFEIGEVISDGILVIIFLHVQSCIRCIMLANTESNF